MVGCAANGLEPKKAVLARFLHEVNLPRRDDFMATLGQAASQRFKVRSALSSASRSAVAWIDVFIGALSRYFNRK